MRIFLAIVLMATVGAAAWVFRNPGMQSLNWTYSYFSGAANHRTLFEWRINPVEFDAVARMSPVQYLAHRHQPSAVTVPNRVNNYGYVLIVAAARRIFPGMGEGNAVVALQVLAHAFIVVAVFLGMKSAPQRIVFLVLFGLNPAILYFVTFPYYYFWTVIPSFAIVTARQRAWRLHPAEILAWAVILGLIFVTRPVTLVISLLFFALLFKAHRSAAALGAGILFLALCLAAPAAAPRAALWHTAFAGIGAYPNPYGITLSDDAAYAYYNMVTGKVISTHPITGTFQDPAAATEYYAVLRGAVRTHLAEAPLLFVRNAVLNGIQSFGPGYITRSTLLNAFSAVIGLAVIALALATRQWLWMAAIAAYAVPFALYFPPVPAYLFGAYLPMVMILVPSMDRAVSHARGMIK